MLMMYTAASVELGYSTLDLFIELAEILSY